MHVVRRKEQNMKMFILLAMLVPAVAIAQENKATIEVADNKYQWSISVDNCPIDKSKKAIILERPTLPKSKVVIRQGKKTFRCNVKEINVTVA